MKEKPPPVIPTEPRLSRGEWRNLKRPLDSADASLGVTEQLTVLPTGATNEVRSGMEESLENIDLSIQLDFLDKIDRIFRMIERFQRLIYFQYFNPVLSCISCQKFFFKDKPDGDETPRLR